MGEITRWVARVFGGAVLRRLGTAAAVAALALFAAKCHASGTVATSSNPFTGYYTCSGQGISVNMPACVGSPPTSGGIGGYPYASISALCTGYKNWIASAAGITEATITACPAAVSQTMTVSAKYNGGGPYTASSTVLGGTYYQTGCPANATLGGSSCTCNSGFVPNAGATACVAQTSCGSVAGQTFTAGYFNMGSDVQMHIAVACGANECEVVYDGATAQEKRIVNGVEQWFAQGLYRYTGQSCAGSTVSASAAPAAASAPPATNTCAANQDAGTVNGVFKCFDRTTGSVASAASTPSVGTTSSTSKVTNPDGSTTTTTTETKRDSAGNEVTTKTVVNTNAGGTSSTTTSTTTGTGATLAGGGSGGGGIGCASNSSGAGCGGAAGGVTGQREPGTKTFAGVLGGLRTAFASTELGTAVNGFFIVTGSGACPTWTWHIPVIGSDHVVDVFCTPWGANTLAAIKLVFLIVCSWFAFRVSME